MQTDEPFKCPKCGSPYFGRDMVRLGREVVPLPTVRCHGSSSGPIIYGDDRGVCPWRGVWPVESKKDQ